MASQETNKMNGDMWFQRGYHVEALQCYLESGPHVSRERLMKCAQIVDLNESNNYWGNGLLIFTVIAAYRKSNATHHLRSFATGVVHCKSRISSYVAYEALQFCTDFTCEEWANFGRQVLEGTTPTWEELEPFELAQKAFKKAGCEIPIDALEKFVQRKIALQRTYEAIPALRLLNRITPKMLVQAGNELGRHCCPDERAELYREAGRTDLMIKIGDEELKCDMWGQNLPGAKEAYERAGANVTEQFVTKAWQELNRNNYEYAIKLFNFVGTDLPRDAIIAAITKSLSEDYSHGRYFKAMELFGAIGYEPPREQLLEWANKFLREGLPQFAIDAFSRAKARTQLIEYGDFLHTKQDHFHARQAFRAAVAIST